MTTSRRQFVKLTAAAGGALGFGILPDAVRAAVTQTPAPKRILILGGTGFIGPHEVRYAVERGHKVTVFNRGRREADLPAAVEHLEGDRNDNLNALKGRDWDVVIDNPTTLPKWVRDSASLLQGHAGQYIFISTISVYADTSNAGMDENTALAQYGGADPYAEERVTNGLYGPLKVLSEREAEKWFPGKTTVIRPGLIVGPGDPSGRFTYWPVRIARGGEVLAPNSPQDPTQVIDARDLSQWTIRMAEQGATGTYNATGPEKPRPVGEMLSTIKGAVGSNATFTWVPADFLAENNVRGWSDLPVWVPPRPDNAGFSRVSIDRALAKGLTFRPLATTAKDTLDWYRSQPAEEQARLAGPLTPEREKEVLAAWHAKNG